MNLTKPRNPKAFGRKYIPMGFYDKSVVCSEANFRIKDAPLYLFGILHSAMHNAWIRTVCGRIRTDYRYSNTIVYNNFIFPTLSDKQKNKIEKISKEIIEKRTYYSKQGNTLVDLYDNLSMPVDLMKLHQ